MASIVPLQINFMFHRILSAHNKLNIFERRTALRSTTIILYSLLFILLSKASVLPYNCYNFSFLISNRKPSLLIASPCIIYAPIFLFYL